MTILLSRWDGFYTPVMQEESWVIIADISDKFVVGRYHQITFKRPLSFKFFVVLTTNRVQIDFHQSCPNNFHRGKFSFWNESHMDKY